MIEIEGQFYYDSLAVFVESFFLLTKGYFHRTGKGKPLWVLRNGMGIISFKSFNPSCGLCHGRVAFNGTVKRICGNLHDHTGHWFLSDVSYFQTGCGIKKGNL